MKSFLGYMGDKSLLANKIVPLIPSHTCYCEVFAGAAWLLFKKQESQVEIINDINLDLVTLYRVIKHHLDEFIRYLRWILVSREDFARFRSSDPETLTDIQRAVRFYYLLKAGYGARIPAPTFSVSTLKPPSLNLLRIEEELSAAHLRLSQVYIENKPYADLIERYDKPHTFFYIDPPYWGCEDYYGKNIFSRTDFQALSSLLSRVAGKWLLSINDTPEVRQLFGQFDIREAETTYLAAGSDRKKNVTELLIRNYP